MMRNRELMIYRGFPDHRDGLLHRMALLMDAFEMGEGHSRERFYGCIHSLLELAGTYGFHGNLWHCYLTHLLVIHENSYSRAARCGAGWRGLSTRRCSMTWKSSRSSSTTTLLPCAP